MSEFDLQRPRHSRKKKRIVGRGASARRGATAGRGTKGQKARSGGGVSPGFEGGQMPLYRRIAIRGFNNARFAREVDVVNIRDLAKHFADGDSVTRESLIEKRLIKRSVQRVKLLANGEIDFKVDVALDSVSASAVKKIVAAGGSVSGEEKVQPDGE